MKSIALLAVAAAGLVTASPHKYDDHLPCPWSMPLT